MGDTLSGVIGYILSLNIRLFLPSLSAQPVRERQKAAMKRRGSNSRGKTHALGLASHRPAMLASCVSRLYRHPATLAPKVSPITPDKVSPITGSNHPTSRTKERGQALGFGVDGEWPRGRAVPNPPWRNNSSEPQTPKPDPISSTLGFPLRQSMTAQR